MSEATPPAADAARLEKYRADLKAAKWGFEYADRRDHHYFHWQDEFVRLRKEQIAIDPTGAIWNECRPANMAAAWTPIVKVAA